jgi:hypothetical protein
VGEVKVRENGRKRVMNDYLEWEILCIVYFGIHDNYITQKAGLWDILIEKNP